MKSRRTSSALAIPMSAHNIQDGKNEPMTLIWGPISSPDLAGGLLVRRLAGTECQRGRRIEQLELRVELDEPRTAELATRGQEIGERFESVTIGLQDRLVGFLGRLQERAGHVEPAHREAHVRVGL